MMLYFAYGSNMDVMQMTRRCKNAELLGPGFIKGFQLAFTRYSQGWDAGVADIVEKKTSEVWGLIYTIDDECLDALDSFEGYPHAYDRRSADVYTSEGERRRAWVYFVREKSTPSKPRKQYLGVMKKAAEKYGFPDEYRTELNAIECVED